MNKKIIEKLTRLGACDEGVEYARSYRTMQEAWDECERGDWMLWLLGRLAGPPESKSRKKLVLAACACARLSLDHIPAGEQRPLAAIEMAEAWARGQDGASLDDVRRTAAAAYAAYASASVAYASAYAAYASASAASAATASASASAASAYAAYATASASASAAYASAYAAYASASAASAYAAYAYAAYASAYASASVAYASAYASARKKTLLQCAEIVRSMYPKAPGLKGEQG